MRGRLALVALLGLALAPAGCREWRAPGDELIEPGFLDGFEIDASMARRFYPALRREGRRVYDPVGHALNVPDAEFRFDWPEHPTGEIVIRTNNLGLRDDAPTHVEKAGHRTLVLGDSHTEGALYNDETYPHVLETLLAERGGEGAPYEVLNAGVGGTGPFAYLGVLRHYAFLEPDLVLATIYAGNDFANALLFSDAYTRRRTTPRDGEYRERLDAAGAVHVQIPQGFNQAYLARLEPRDVPLMVDAVLLAIDAMAAHCARHGADFAVVIIPTKVDVDLTHGLETTRGILRALDLDAEDYAVNARMVESLVARLEARGIPVVDPTSRMRAVDEPLYWDKDHHLDPAGQRLLARIVLDELGGMIP